MEPGCLWAGCVPVGDGALPYAPIVEALRALHGDLGASAVRELAGPSWPELDRGGPVLRIELARLDQVQTGAQLVGILGAAPAVELVEDIFIRSNPFFTEELLAAVRAGSGEQPGPCATCSAAGSKRCPSRRGRCLRWLRWPAGGCRTGCWRRWPA